MDVALLPQLCVFIVDHPVRLSVSASALVLTKAQQDVYLVYVVLIVRLLLWSKNSSQSEFCGQDVIFLLNNEKNRK